MDIPFTDISPAGWKHAEEAILAAEAKGAPIILRDLSGLEKNEPMDRELATLCPLGTVWLMAGPRNADTALDMLVLGAARVVVSAEYFSSAEDVDRVLEDTDNVMLAVASTGGRPKPALGSLDLAGIEASMERWSVAGMPAVIAWSDDGDHPASFSPLARFPGLLYQRGGAPIHERARRILPFAEWKMMSGGDGPG